ncbi:TetR/AcrR family transcriptional regulator [Heyndrickxia acidicola]|uniref:TetR/AcrR family transcriptional regulator n=1 Tax=Heyndrickxia acidicola TaxID=209389 RepID=A0ABU6MHH8_9BACI|nr:TetR/AcrR family transcriptional regulator [Heyndrickxia acidicola]MED1203853.1 TetR/AcrR family transcriptional regulator [Heyndrickxia acidicola]
MDGYQRRTERKKEMIKQAALNLFSSYGADKVSVAEISKKANVSPVTIYNYFGSKDELLRAVLVDYMDKSFEEYRELIYSDRPFSEKIEQVIFRKTETAKELSPEFLQSLTDPGIQALFEEYTNEKSMPLAMELIDQGKKQGYINPKLTTEAILFYIHIFTETTQKKEGLGLLSKDALIDLVELFFYGLMGSAQLQREQ